MIAQDIEKVYLELVETDSEGMKSVNYSHLVVPMIEAVKALYSRSVGIEASQAKEIATVKAELAEKDQQILELKIEKDREVQMLKNENDLMKSELCKKDSYYSFCKH